MEIVSQYSSFHSIYIKFIPNLPPSYYHNAINIIFAASEFGETINAIWEKIEFYSYTGSAWKSNLFRFIMYGVWQFFELMY